MTGYDFLILFGLSSFIVLCDGKVSPPPDGNEFILLPGSTVNITWSFDDALDELSTRTWSFRRLGERTVGLAKIDGVADMKKKSNLPLDFDIKKPATLVLRNVNQSYNGTYKFSLSPSTSPSESEVVVFIVVTPNVTFSCPKTTTLNKGDNFTCECRGQGGNPPANVAWYKDGVQIGKTGNEEQTLSIINFGENDRGNYTCKAQSHVNVTDEKSIELSMYLKPNVTVNCSSNIVVNEGKNFICECKCEYGNPPAECTWYKNNTQIGKKGIEVNELNLSKVSREDRGSYTCVGQSHVKARDEKSITVTVYFKPEKTVIALSTKSVEIGGTVTITCVSDGFPEPRFLIFHNNTKVVSTEKTYTICEVNWDDAGTYKCFASNTLGNDSSSAFLTVSGANADITRPTLTSTPNDGTEKSASEQCNCSIKEWLVIVVSLVSGIFGFFLSYIVSYSRRKWFTNRSREPTPEAQIMAGALTYQELDLTKLNKEDNYQSLRKNAARNEAVNDDESNYAELNKTREDENNYQSLT